MIELFSYNLSNSDLIILLVSAMFIGMSKTGIPGAGMIGLPMIALIVGSKASSGLVLPLLIAGDLFAIYYFRKHADWSHLKRLLPLSMIGIVIASVIGANINDVIFSRVMATSILIILAVMLWLETRSQPKIPNSTWFIAIVAILSGFSSMIGNMAGPVIGLYLLAMRLPKQVFIGTGAWYFLIVNTVKVPFHVFYWETITLNSFLMDLVLLIGLTVGALIGYKMIKILPEKIFRYFVIAVTFFASIKIFISSI